MASEAFFGQTFGASNLSFRDLMLLLHEEGAIGVDYCGDFGVPDPESVGQPFPVVAI
jgi:hypothetical protein